MNTKARMTGEYARKRLLADLPVTDRRLHVQEISTALLEGGSGPPVLLLQLEFGAVWMRVIPDLVKAHSVITPDLPGLGASQIPDGRLDSARVLSWLGELVDRTCPDPPVLVGKGPAGSLAARFAVAHGDRLSRLLLVDAHGLAPFRPPPGMVLSYLGVMVHPTEGTLDRSFRNYCFTDLDGMRTDMGERYEWMAAYALDRFQSSSVRSAMRKLMTWLSRPIPSERLLNISVPTTLIWGRHDVGMPLHVAEDASERYGWPLQVIEDSRDDPALEQPRAFLAAFDAALSR
jgi:pimeloyl-ACP methyl ester carboxylesterase